MALFGFDSSVVPEIDFAVKDASVIESEVITNYENYYALITKIALTLGRADPRRLLLLTMIYQLVVQRSIIDSTGKENLLKYAHGDDLVNIGALYGERCLPLPATKATTILRFSLGPTPLTSDSTIPAGTLAQTGSEIKFATIISGTISAGLLTIDLPAEAVDAGKSGNGFVPGQINSLIQWSAPFLVTVSNTTTSGGGADKETDDHLRARIWMAPESFSVAGPKEAYESWAGTANPDIVDVSVWSDASVAGQVYIYPLMTGGVLPDSNVIAQVYAKCNADDIRPLTDQVFVQAPIASNYKITATYWIDNSKGQFEDDIKTAVQTAYENFKAWQSSEIGLDINPSKLDQMLVDAGAKRTQITFPVFTVLDEKTVAVLDQANSLLTYGGLEEK